MWTSLVGKKQQGFISLSLSRSLMWLLPLNSSTIFFFINAAFCMRFFFLECERPFFIWGLWNLNGFIFITSVFDDWLYVPCVKERVCYLCNSSSQGRGLQWHLSMFLYHHHHSTLYENEQKRDVLFPVRLHGGTRPVGPAWALFCEEDGTSQGYS